MRRPSTAKSSECRVRPVVWNSAAWQMRCRRSSSVARSPSRRWARDPSTIVSFAGSYQPPEDVRSLNRTTGSRPPGRDSASRAARAVHCASRPATSSWRRATRPGTTGPTPRPVTRPNPGRRSDGTGRRPGRRATEPTRGTNNVACGPAGPNPTRTNLPRRRLRLGISAGSSRLISFISRCPCSASSRRRRPKVAGSQLRHPGGVTRGRSGRRERPVHGVRSRGCRGLPCTLRGAQRVGT